MNTFVDIGINLMNRAYQSDRDEVIQRAISGGVNRMIITGTNLKSSQEASVLAKGHPEVLFSTAGIHPHDAKNCTASVLIKLKELAKNDEVVAIGECGLDFNRMFSPQAAQEDCFKKQLVLAKETGKPLFLHERDAHQRFVEIMLEHKEVIPNSVVHCFTGNEKEIKEYLDLGFYIGITGWICDERRGVELRKAVKHIPLDRLLIETDGPYLTPKGLNPTPSGGRNEPCFLPHIADAIATCMGISATEVANASTANAKNFFRL
jgi:TatD DNase family protein